MALPVAVVAVVLCAFPQSAGSPAPSPEIRGMVVELGTNLAVPGAEVRLAVKGSGPINGGWEPSASRTVKTDFSGAFTIQLDKFGEYRVDAKAEGYQGRGVGSSGNIRPVTLTADDPVGKVTLFLYRPGGLSGRVVDEETGKPLANLGVIASQIRYLGGMRLAGGPNKGNTGADGSFLVSNLDTGDYVADIGFQTEEKKRVMTEFTEKDLETVDRDFDHTYWPGGHGLEIAVPLTIASGLTEDVGVIRVRKVPYYRVHVRVIPTSKCEADDTVTVYQQTRDSQSGTHIWDLANAPCGKDLLVTGFLPGSHRLIFGRRPASSAGREMASVPFVITDKNIEITAALDPGIVVDGSFVVAEGAKLPDLTNTRIQLDSPDTFASADRPPVGPSADGRFLMAGVPAFPARVEVWRIKAGYYVKEIRYNGTAAGHLIPLEQSSLTHSLTIILDDKPAAIGGAVMDGDKPVNTPFVVLKKWPPSAGLGFGIGALTATGDNKGKFQFSNVPPGEYRMVALRSIEEYIYRVPDVLERAMAAASKIELGPKGFQNATLELIKLR
jgi:hypothetical protein